MTVDTTWLTRLTAAVVLYYAGLLAVRWALSRRRHAERPVMSGRPPLVVLVVPSYNEEAVIGDTLTSLRGLDYPHRLIIVMNDGSQDATSDIAGQHASYGEIHVVNRGAGWSTQRGKGRVLNHAFEILRLMVAQDHPLLEGRDPSEVIVGIMDADGQLDRDALTHVVPCFADSRVGGVQIGVRIANVEDNWLTRMQDIEFVGFSGFVQHARNAFGSVGLGGNGQFTRLSALLALGREPWTDCLSEDLDLGLSLVEAGHHVRYCPDTFVAQQGLTKLGPLVRQRTRWVQGHYQCWRHLPVLARSHRVAWRTKVDLSLYLTLIVFVLLIGASSVLSLAGLLGAVQLINHGLDFVPAGLPFRVTLLVLALGPPLTFIATYQHRAEKPLALFELPAFTLLFCCYGYHWLAAQLVAFWRMALGRRNWVKTARVTARATAS